MTLGSLRTHILRYNLLQMAKHLTGVLILGTSLMITSVAWSYEMEDPASSSEHQKMLATDSLITTILGKLPNSDFKRGISRYFEALGLKEYEGQTVGHSNVGLNVYFSQKTTQNDCFGALANQFYMDVTAQDRQLMKKMNIPLSQLGKLPRPTLNDRAGAGIYADLKPGWLWNKALLYTNGDANLAISLIGVCGHDDVNQGPYDFFDTTDYGKVFIKDQAENSSNEYYKIAMEKGYASGVECPQMESTLYLAQSLGSQYDIPMQFKKEIIQTQTRQSDLKKLPSKDYHVLGSAFASCLLIQEGIAPAFAERIQKEAARAYRGLRQCENINNPVQMYDKMQAAYSAELKAKGINYRQLHFENFIYLKAFQISQMKECSGPIHHQPEDCSFFEPMIRGNQLSSTANKRKNIHEFIVNIVAAHLYRVWFMGKVQVLGLSIPCADFNLFGPKNILPERDEHPRLNFMCGSSVSSLTCQAARQKIGVWLNDFQWTVHQHSRGAAFASRFCQKENLVNGKRNQPYTRACGPLQTAPQVFPEPLTDE